LSRDISDVGRTFHHSFVLKGFPIGMPGELLKVCASRDTLKIQSHRFKVR
jgi:uncharacterized protein (DUF3820 family)